MNLMRGPTCHLRSYVEDREENSLEKANLALIVGQVRNIEGLIQIRGKRAVEESRAKILHIRAV